jgi:hypothetical protein
MKKIVNYCSGGLGNRLKPLASCYAISQLTGRKLETYWHPTMRCGGIFEKLFPNSGIENIEKDWLHTAKDAKIYSEQSYIDHDAGMNGNPQLQDLSRRFPVVSLSQSQQILNDQAETIIVYDNGFLGGIDEQKTNEFFKILKPNEKIQSEVARFCRENKIDKTVVGVHARGTDFEASGVNAEHYLNLIRSHVKPGRKFLLCSDSQDYETTIKAAFPNNIIVREKSNYVTKAAQHYSWVNNVETPHESVEEALIDIYTLAKTSFLLYNNASTFAHLVLELIKSRN